MTFAGLCSPNAWGRIPDGSASKLAMFKLVTKLLLAGAIVLPLVIGYRLLSTGHTEGLSLIFLGVLLFAVGMAFGWSLIGIPFALGGAWVAIYGVTQLGQDIRASNMDIGKRQQQMERPGKSGSQNRAVPLAIQSK